eukprot:7007608-Prymnesium_polylepis.3
MHRRLVWRDAGDQALPAVDGRSTCALCRAAAVGQITREALADLSVAVSLAVVVRLSTAGVQHDDQCVHRTREEFRTTKRGDRMCTREGCKSRRVRE